MLNMGSQIIKIRIQFSGYISGIVLRVFHRPRRRYGTTTELESTNGLGKKLQKKNQVTPTSVYRNISGNNFTSVPKKSNGTKSPLYLRRTVCKRITDVRMKTIV